MTEDGTGLPGSGEVENPREGTSDAPPPSPQGASHDAEPPSAPRGSEGSNWPLCLIAGLAGCGCLIVVGIVAAFAFYTYRLYSPPEQQPQPYGPSSAPEAPLDGAGQPEEDESETSPEPPRKEPRPVEEQQPTADPADQQGPGAGAAMAWANNRRAEWEATIEDHSDDWQEVWLSMGPPGSGGTTWVHIRWNTPSGRYGLVDEGPIASEEYEEQPGAEEDIPEVYRPGEEVAKEAALGYAEQPDWVARVDSHSDDWRQVSVSVGPPASEFVWVVNLTWNDQLDVYDQVSMDDVDYPGME